MDEAKYYSLQFTIYTTLNNIRFLLENADKMQGLVNISDTPLADFPHGDGGGDRGSHYFCYPFFQRYFIRGLTMARSRDKFVACTYRQVSYPIVWMGHKNVQYLERSKKVSLKDLGILEFC